MPQTADVLIYPEWNKSGKKDCLDRAKKKMEHIMVNHEVSIHLTISQKKIKQLYIRKITMLPLTMIKGSIM